MEEPFGNLNYLRVAQGDASCTTSIPPSPSYRSNWDGSQPEVVGLIRANPDRYSLVQHGNNHDGYEFYKYNLAANDPKDDPDYRARPLSEQEADIVEGLQRMAKLSSTFLVPFDRVMVFPYGISPEPTLVLLKKYNYLATVNAQEVPLDATRPPTWDYGMYQANMDYGGFPALTRRPIGRYKPLQPKVEPFIFDLLHR